MHTAVHVYYRHYCMSSFRASHLISIGISIDLAKEDTIRGIKITRFTSSALAEESRTQQQQQTWSINKPQQRMNVTVAIVKVGYTALLRSPSGQQQQERHSNQRTGFFTLNFARLACSSSGVSEKITGFSPINKL